MPEVKITPFRNQPDLALHLSSSPKWLLGLRMRAPSTQPKDLGRVTVTVCEVSQTVPHMN